MLTEYRLVIEENRKKEGGGMFSHREEGAEGEAEEDKGKKGKGKKEEPKIPTLREVTGNATPPPTAPGGGRGRKKNPEYEGIDV